MTSSQRTIYSIFSTPYFLKKFNENKLAKIFWNRNAFLTFFWYPRLFIVSDANIEPISKLIDKIEFK